MRALVLTACLACAGLTACGAGTTKVARVAEAERFGGDPAQNETRALAPQAFAEAESWLRAAKEAEARGDTTAADLLAERAIAGFQRAIAQARLARATSEEAHAKDDLARAEDQLHKWSSERKEAEREAEDLDKQLKIAREAHLPASSGPADPERERARVVAAQALTAQARLLCSAASLVSSAAPGLADAETKIAALEKKLAARPKGGPAIDEAARLRAACLTALTKARRGGHEDPDRVDALLSELSQSADPKAKSTTDLAPARDERGVVLTLRDVFQGDALDKGGETTLKDLGRVAAAHPGFALQVVVHDAAPPSAADKARDDKRGEAVKKALVAGGADGSKIKVEQAGANAPVVDPKDAKRRERNARVEIVFVAAK